MSWPDRGGRQSAEVSAAAPRDPPESLDGSEAAGVDRTSPGISALFEGLAQDGSHSILDLGLPGDLHLRILSRFATQIRFAGWVPGPPQGEHWTAALTGLPPNTPRPYDVVLAWDILDRIDPPQQGALIARLAEVTSSTAHLYAFVDSSGASTTQPVRSTLAEANRVSVRPVGPREPARPPLLPAPMERLLAPFEVTQAFTLRTGLREYVAARRS